MRTGENEKEKQTTLRWGEGAPGIERKGGKIPKVKEPNNKVENTREAEVETPVHLGEGQESAGSLDNRETLTSNSENGRDEIVIERKHRETIKSKFEWEGRVKVGR